MLVPVPVVVIWGPAAREVTEAGATGILVSYLYLVSLWTKCGTWDEVRTWKRAKGKRDGDKLSDSFDQVQW